MFLTKKFWGPAALLLCALIWGLAFSAQSKGMEHLGPCSFNGLRSLVGGIALLPCIALLDLLGHRRPTVWGGLTGRGRYILGLGGLSCGVVLAVASLSQQIGIQWTTVGKAGFITALYIIIVPVIGFFLKQRTGWIVWAAAVIAIIGMYLLCGVSANGGGLNKGDLWLLGCAVLFSLHILVIAHFAPLTDCVRMSCIQFFIAGIISLAIAFLTGEHFTLSDIRLGLGALLFCGILSSGVAYTLQIIGQKYVHPVIASLLMSLESVFSAIGGWLILNQKLSGRELTGCAIIFAAVILAQLPVPANHRG